MTFYSLEKWQLVIYKATHEPLPCFIWTIVVALVFLLPPYNDGTRCKCGFLFNTLECLSQKSPSSSLTRMTLTTTPFSCSFPLLLFRILLCPCGCTACVMLLCHHIPPWPVPDSKLYWQGERKEKNRAEGRNWLRWQTERRQERVAHWDHCRCDAMEMLVAPAHNLELKAYKHNMFITRFLELIVEYRGFKRIWPH